MESETSPRDAGTPVFDAMKAAEPTQAIAELSRLTELLYRQGIARLDLRLSSGTYVRSIAAALGGHCASLRRTEVGPFRIEEADPERFISPEEALARIGEPA